ncbi:MAG: 2-C-methyl-D-erythritol 4-phosphate cytidylyltransferase [Firmicutes bacterium]|nr:2-C-methyl-D-erythritol 4-phosphate cytidylyltransferase [Bacillota bacterium]
MEARPFVTAVIAAGGAGVRMGGAVPKQFLDLCGRPVLAWTVGVFDASPAVDDVVLVVPGGYEDFARECIISRYGFKKCREVVPGGGGRSASVAEGIRRARPETGILVVHDGVRPFTGEREIEAVVGGAVRYGACAPAVRLKETLKLIRANGGATGDFAVSTPDRDSFRLIQTPQAFGFGLIKEAYGRAAESGLAAGDDSALAEALGVRTFLIEGNYANIKITTAEDMVFAEAWLKKNGRRLR